MRHNSDEVEEELEEELEEEVEEELEEELEEEEAILLRKSSAFEMKASDG